MLVIMLLLC